MKKVSSVRVIAYICPHCDGMVIKPEYVIEWGKCRRCLGPLMKVVFGMAL